MYTSVTGPVSGCVRREGLKRILYEFEEGVEDETEGTLSQHERPKKRKDCPKGVCPWVGCRYHLYLTVTQSGEVYVDPRGLDGMPYTCALTAAEEGPLTLEETGSLMGVTREYVRQLAEKAADSVYEVLDEDFLDRF